jgi:hypothetical protein
MAGGRRLLAAHSREREKALDALEIAEAKHRPVPTPAAIRWSISSAAHGSRARSPLKRGEGKPDCGRLGDA